MVGAWSLSNPVRCLVSAKSSMLACAVVGFVCLRIMGEW